MEMSDPEITENDLKFLVTLCILSLKDLGYIHRDQIRSWGIVFKEECEERGVLGGTLLNDGVQGILINPNAKKDNILSTIAHEAVHLIQFMKGDAQNGQGYGEIVWKGETHKVLPGNHENHAEYDSQPWEEEAYRLAPQIVADLRKVPIDQITQVWLTYGASQWSLGLFTNIRW